MTARPGGAPRWADIHGETSSWRKQLVGEINEAFVVPRYVRLFYDTFGDRRGLDFCEIGSGNGDLSVAVLAENHGGVIRRYLTSEMFAEGVDWLRKRGLQAVQADAHALPWNDEEFDASVDFDVMHHVHDPRAMAREMMRVARGRCLLVESNGLSVFRKLKELTPGHRAAGERSFTPRRWRRFFEGHAQFELIRFEVDPFLFPFKCPRRWLPLLVRFNQVIETVPVLRWQCSSLMIRIRYRRTDRP